MKLFRKATAVLLVLSMLITAIPLTVFGETAETSLVRYTVLVLDNSGSMSGIPMARTKQSAIRFCDQLFRADGENYIALVVFNTDASILNGFTDDFDLITQRINGISPIGQTNTEHALRIAGQVLDDITDEEAIKNIVLMTDGLPEYSVTDAYIEGGKYSRDDDGENGYIAQYANPAYNAAVELQEKYYIYTLGFYHEFILEPVRLGFARRFLNDIQNAGYYEVGNPDELEFIFEDVAYDIISKQTGTFPYGTGDIAVTYYYNDAYFVKGASIYNPSLATMSLCLTMSAGYYQQAANLFDQIGFKDFEIIPFFLEKTPSEDSIGVVAGHKEIFVNGEYCTVIALTGRGENYTTEWASNFTVGESGLHQGFKTASNHAYEFLSDYINKHRSKFHDKIKFWFAGYSRASATVNLLAGRLDDEKQIAGIPINKEDLYAYCFATPKGALLDNIEPAGDYSNIHNIVNPNDIVPKMAPVNWGFYRYGVLENVIPTAATSKNYASESEKMLEKFKELDNDTVNKSLVNDGSTERHAVDTFQAKRIDLSKTDFNLGHWEVKTDSLGQSYTIWVSETQIDLKLVGNSNKSMSNFLDDVFLALARGIGSRQNYTIKLQSAARLVIAQIMGEGYEQNKWNHMKDILAANLQDNIYDIAAAYVWSGQDAVEGIVLDILLASIEEAGIDLNAYLSLPDAFAEAIRSVVRILVESFMISGGSDLITLYYNMAVIVPAHYAELYLAWLKMQDVNYTPAGGALFLIDSYRFVRINCPVDVSVYDSDNRLVAQIIDNEPQEIEGSAIIASLNSDGEKIIYLPADESYTVNINATGEGELNYAVGEYSYKTEDCAKVVNFYDIPCVAGDTYVGYIPKYEVEDIENTSSGSGVNYTLSSDNDALIPEEILLGEDAQAAVCLVQVENDNPEGGRAIGGAAYVKGSFSQVSATAFDECEFLGWYNGDALVSSENLYRFRVEEDLTLTAKFNGTRKLPEVDDSQPLINQVLADKSKISYGAGAEINVVVEGEHLEGAAITASLMGKYTTVANGSAKLTFTADEISSPGMYSLSVTAVTNEGKTSTASAIVAVVGKKLVIDGDTASAVFCVPADEIYNCIIAEYDANNRLVKISVKETMAIEGAVDEYTVDSFNVPFIVGNRVEVFIWDKAFVPFC